MQAVLAVLVRGFALLDFSDTFPLGHKVCHVRKSRGVDGGNPWITYAQLHFLSEASKVRLGLVKTDITNQWKFFQLELLR